MGLPLEESQRNRLLQDRARAAGEAHALSPTEVARALATDSVSGLSEEDARRRLAQYGPNALEQRRRPRDAAVAARQITDLMVGLLFAAAVVSVAIGEGVDAIVIGAIVLLNGALGFGQELGAERAVMALRETLLSQAWVIRDGRERALPTRELVPGDLFVLSEGERVPADGRIIWAEGLAIDEAALTGGPCRRTSRPLRCRRRRRWPIAARSSMGVPR